LTLIESCQGRHRRQGSQRSDSPGLSPESPPEVAGVLCPPGTRYFRVLFFYARWGIFYDTVSAVSWPVCIAPSSADGDNVRRSDSPVTVVPVMRITELGSEDSLDRTQLC